MQQPLVENENDSKTSFEQKWKRRPLDREVVLTWAILTVLAVAWLGTGYLVAGTTGVKFMFVLLVICAGILHQMMTL